MARILITGASDGLGQMAAQRLIAEGHAVVLHARNAIRAEHAMQQAPGAEAVFSADLSSIAETRQLAGKLNASGHFDAVIHNAAVGYQEPERLVTVDGLPHVLAVNTLAPYILTALMARPQRLIYISSVLHHQGPAKTHPAAANVDLQDAFLSACAALSGVEFPASSPSF